MNSEFIITLAAAKRISDLTKDVGSSGLRVIVLGGGCSGFQYEFDYKATPDKEDHVYKYNDANVYIDPTSFEFLQNCTLDYVEDLGSAGFEIKNPNAASNCGCGKSFSI